MRSLDRRLAVDLLLLASFSSLSEMLLFRTELCFLAKAMGHPAVQAGLSPILNGNSYTVISWKETILFSGRSVDRVLRKEESLEEFFPVMIEGFWRERVERSCDLQFCEAMYRTNLLRGWVERRRREINWQLIRNFLHLSFCTKAVFNDQNEFSKGRPIKWPGLFSMR